MRIIGRYVTIALLLLVGFYFLGGRNRSPETPVEEEVVEKNDAFTVKPRRAHKDNGCTMEKCFDFSKCKDVDNLKVFVYPDTPSGFDVESSTSATHSVVYSNILRVIRESPFYTNDSSKACLFVLNIDTIDRDLRSQNYVQDIGHLIKNLPQDLWNGGKNHVILNLYHGTFPDYADQNLGFNIGQAMVGRASSSSETLNYGFDFGFPLFHKEHPIRSASVPRKNTTSHRIMLSFKGKRYVYGIGSETRDSLHHLHNGQKSIMVTTCKHNNDWMKFKDSRCEEDNAQYDKWDYEELLANSTFCLTPRGRRLGSFRFLETLRAGCIPVVLSDNWELPFSEVIDWSEAALTASEKDVLLISDMLWDVTVKRIQHMRKRGTVLYHKHFSSVEKIVRTTFEMIFERIRRRANKPPRLSTKFNGVSHVALRGSAHLHGTEAVVLCNSKYSNRINRIVTSLNKMDNITSIVVLWPSARGQPPEIEAFKSALPLSLHIVPETSTDEFLRIRTNKTADFLLFIDERVQIAKKDMVTLHQSLLSSPNRFVSWHSVGLKINDSPLGLLNFAAVRRSIVSEYFHWLPTNARQWADKGMRHCHAILFNLMMIDISMAGADVVSPVPPEQWMKVRNYSVCANKISSMLYDNNLQLSSAQSSPDQ